MSFREKATERLVEELYRVMSSPYFMRLSNVFWRVMNERQQAKVRGSADLAELEARVRGVEQTAERLLAKLDALEALLDARGRLVPRPRVQRKAGKGKVRLGEPLGKV